MGIRYGCRKLIGQAAPAEQAAFYQCRYDGNRTGQLGQLLRIFMHMREGPAGCRELFADYQKKRIFDQVSVRTELAGYDTVSFDVFDTLVMRSVKSPADVFRKMEERHLVPGFAQHRIEAEKLARQRKYVQYGTTEVCIEDIYKVLSAQHLDGGISGAQELEMELCCCRPNPAMQQTVQILLSAGRRVIAVSDMYLHQEQVLRILQKCGYTGFDKLYVSCDWQAGKSDGKLFPAVLQEFGSSGRMVHIGDNFYADVYRPKGLDLKTMHYIKKQGVR